MAQKEDKMKVVYFLISIGLLLTGCIDEDVRESNRQKCAQAAAYHTEMANDVELEIIELTGLLAKCKHEGARDQLILSISRLQTDKRGYIMWAAKADRKSRELARVVE